MFSPQQKEYIQSRGSQLANVEQQVRDFQAGFPFLNLDRPATIGDGIIQLSEAQLEAAVTAYESLMTDQKMIKFVPASGAATRMFKDLFEYLSSGSMNDGTRQFIHGIKDFAFYSELTTVLNRQGQTIDDLIQSEHYEPIVKALLLEDGLNYGSLPKGLLMFHGVEGARTPIEEHLVEGAMYARQPDGKVQLHFTVSPEHQSRFEEKLNQVTQTYEQSLQVKYSVTFSQQKKSTDTIAVDRDNQPFLEDGKLLFRPAGHGALLENLNDLSADVIFVKNIDNVVPDHLKADTITYKKALASLLVQFQQDAFEWQKRLDVNENDWSDILAALQSKYSIVPDISAADELKKYLNRPIRVCGMVENTGEPGGGPFWVKDENGIALQIAETAQIDLDNPSQKDILMKSSHFNPVDLVCGVKNYKGEKFDLLHFRNNKTGFITEKSKNGRALKAMELPGLWNGAMANWITLFVEVPITTFNPVKTVNDLLKPNHQ